MTCVCPQGKRRALNGVLDHAYTGRSCEVCRPSLLFTEVANLVELCKLGQATCDVAVAVRCRCVLTGVLYRCDLVDTVIDRSLL